MKRRTLGEALLQKRANLEERASSMWEFDIDREPKEKVNKEDNLHRYLN